MIDPGRIYAGSDRGGSIRKPSTNNDPKKIAKEKKPKENLKRLKRRVSPIEIPFTSLFFSFPLPHSNKLFLPEEEGNLSQIFVSLMASPNQEAIDTFTSITGASEAVALQKLQVIFRFESLISRFHVSLDWLHI